MIYAILVLDANGKVMIYRWYTDLVSGISESMVVIEWAVVVQWRQWLGYRLLWKFHAKPRLIFMIFQGYLQRKSVVKFCHSTVARRTRHMVNTHPTVLDYPCLLWIFDCLKSLSWMFHHIFVQKWWHHNRHTTHACFSLTLWSFCPRRQSLNISAPPPNSSTASTRVHCTHCVYMCYILKSMCM